MTVTIKHRGDTAANWAAANPVLAVREMGLELDTQRFKVGDGVTNWNALGYWGGTDSTHVCNGRLTLVSSNPVTTNDVSGATAVFFTPYNGNKISLYNGTDWALHTFGELSKGLGTLVSGLPYDVFIYNNAGSLELELVAWADATTRDTALTTQDGVYVLSGDAPRRYLGTFYTTSTTTTEDSVSKRFLWNYYNRVDKRLYAQEAGSWVYGSAVWRPAKDNAGYRVHVVIGVPDTVLVTHKVTCMSVSNSDYLTFGIGLDNETTTSGDDASIGGAISTYSAGDAFYLDVLTAGYHYFQPLEYASSGQVLMFGTLNKIFAQWSC